MSMTNVEANEEINRNEYVNISISSEMAEESRRNKKNMKYINIVNE